MIQVKTAEKKQTKFKGGIAGPPGGGKTYTLLKLAQHLTSSLDKVLIVDTEHGSAEKYADIFPGWKTVQPARYDLGEAVEFIDYAVAHGFELLGFDSFSHYWAGAGGALERVAGNATNWRTVTPQWERLVDKIISAKIHIIACMRAKVEYSFEKDEKTGKTNVTRVGVKPIVRDDVEYVFDVYGLLDQGNNLTILKSRAKQIPLNSVWPQPGEALAKAIKEYCADGAEDRFVLPVEIRDKFNALAAAMGQEQFDTALTGAGYASLLAIPSLDEARKLYSSIQAALKGKG